MTDLVKIADTPIQFVSVDSGKEGSMAQAHVELTIPTIEISTNRDSGVLDLGYSIGTFDYTLKGEKKKGSIAVGTALSFHIGDTSFVIPLFPMVKKIVEEYLEYLGEGNT